MARVSFVIISHSHELAKGVVDLATQMAPDVHFEIAAGDDTGALGTSMHKVENALDRALAQVHKPGDEECCRGVLLMCDLGSATMVAQTVLELRGDPKDCMCINAPLVEGTIAAAVAARGGLGLRQVAAAAYQSVIDMAGRARSELGQITSVSLDANSNVLSSLDASKPIWLSLILQAYMHVRPLFLSVHSHPWTSRCGSTMSMPRLFLKLCPWEYVMVSTSMFALRGLIATKRWNLPAICSRVARIDQ